MSIEANKEVIEGNKLIAEFMCVNRYTHINKKTSYYIEGVECTDETLKYHSSWDWLMGVVEKINEIDITPVPNWTGYRIEIVPRGYVKISGFPMPPINTNVSIEGSLIAATYKAVVQFIQWHNKEVNQINNQ